MCTQLIECTLPFFLIQSTLLLILRTQKVWKVEINNEILCLGVVGVYYYFPGELNAAACDFLKFLLSCICCLNAFANLTLLILNVHVFFHLEHFVSKLIISVNSPHFYVQYLKEEALLIVWSGFECLQLDNTIYIIKIIMLKYY